MGFEGAERQKSNPFWDDWLNWFAQIRLDSSYIFPNSHLLRTEKQFCDYPDNTWDSNHGRNYLIN